MVNTRTPPRDAREASAVMGGVWSGAGAADASTMCARSSSGLIALSLAAVTFMLARRAMLRRLGGTTGDTAGALLELVECTVLVGLALQL